MDLVRLIFQGRLSALVEKIEGFDDFFEDDDEIWRQPFIGTAEWLMTRAQQEFNLYGDITAEFLEEFMETADVLEQDMRRFVERLEAELALARLWVKEDEENGFIVEIEPPEEVDEEEDASDQEAEP